MTSRLLCGHCNEEMEFKYDDYYLEYRGEIELILGVPQHVCHTCEYTAVANSDIEIMERYTEAVVYRG